MKLFILVTVLLLTPYQVFARNLGSPCDLFFSNRLNIESLIGKRLIFTSFETGKTHYFPYGKYRSEVFEPKSGIGNLIVFNLLDQASRENPLNDVLRAFPEYFARFDIYADDQKLVMSDSLRLNSLNPRGVQFMDVPFFTRQFYEDEYFYKIIEKGFVPLASKGEQFFHDRLAEHLLAALVTPEWLWKVFLLYPRYEKAWLNSNAMVKNPTLLNLYNANKLSLSKEWDDYTKEVGRIIAKIARSRKVESDDVVKIAGYFFETTQRLSPGPNSQIITLFKNALERNQQERFTIISREMMNLKAAYPQLAITKELALEEAIRVLNEVTGLSKEELIKIWGDRSL